VPTTISAARITVPPGELAVGGTDQHGDHHVVVPGAVQPLDAARRVGVTGGDRDGQRGGR